jgi:hypothetical protein
MKLTGPIPVNATLQFAAPCSSGTRRGAVSDIDCKKELIITSGGKNVSPAYLEAALKSRPAYRAGGRHR